jgi:preprotein translocase subunit YajC
MNFSLITIAVIVFILWLAIFVFYLYTSRQQETIEEEIDRIQRMLDKED